VQETAFVLYRLKVEPVKIHEVVQNLFPYWLENYDLSPFKRAVELARLMGFQNINDCLHAAIAEEHCDELYTYDKADFKRIKDYIRLKIRILQVFLS
jgi:predicted nucleic acid-binding protein